MITIIEKNRYCRYKKNAFEAIGTELSKESTYIDLHKNIFITGGIFNKMEKTYMSDYQKEIHSIDWLKQQFFIYEVEKNQDFNCYDVKPFYIQRGEKTDLLFFKAEFIILDRRLLDFYHTAFSFFYDVAKQSPYRIIELTGKNKKDFDLSDKTLKTVKIRDIITSLIKYHRDHTLPGNYAREIRKYCQFTNLLFNSKTTSPAIFFFQNQDDYFTFTENHQNLLKHAIIEKTDTETIVFCFYNGDFVDYIDTNKNKLVKRKISDIKMQTEVRQHALDSLYQRCALFQDLISGNNLHENEKHHLFTNAMYIKGATAKFYNHVQEDMEYWKICEKTNKVIQTPPEVCGIANCKHYNQCKNKGTIITKLNTKKGEIIRTEEKSLLTLTQGFSIMEQKFLEFIESNSNNLKILKAPTGIGKTELFSRHLKSDVVIVSPTHEMRKETVERLLVSMNDEIQNLYRKQDKTEEELQTIKDYIDYHLEIGTIATVEDIPFYSEEFNAEVMKQYEAGNYREANLIISEKVKEIQKKDIYTEEDELLIRYDRNRKEIEKTNKLAVITHQRYLYSRNLKHSNIIVDEDILSKLIFSVSSNIGQLKTISKAINQVIDATTNSKNTTKRKLNQLIEFIDGIKNNKTEKTCCNQFSAKERGVLISAMKFVPSGTVNPLDIIDSVKIYKSTDGHFSGVVRKSMPYIKEKNIIITSATSSSELWNMYAKSEGFDIDFHDIGLVENTGNIYQYTKHSFSRRYLKCDDKQDITAEQKQDIINQRLGYVKNIIGDIPVISYKFCQDWNQLNFKEGYYFGNTAGKDGLKGQDICVLGTPMVPPVQVRLIAEALDVKYKENDLVSDTPKNPGGFKYQEVSYSGFNFWSATYSNQDLRTIQFYLATEEIYQAIGRSRSIRTNADVKVFSSFPIDNAILIRK